MMLKFPRNRVQFEQRGIRFISVGADASEQPVLHLKTSEATEKALAELMLLSPEQPGFILIGLDGQPKLRQKKLASNRLFQAIDQMPMARAGHHGTGSKN